METHSKQAEIGVRVRPRMRRRVYEESYRPAWARTMVDGPPLARLRFVLAHLRFVLTRLRFVLACVMLDKCDIFGPMIKSSTYQVLRIGAFRVSTFFFFTILGACDINVHTCLSVTTIEQQYIGW